MVFETNIICFGHTRHKKHMKRMKHMKHMKHMSRIFGKTR